MTAYCERKDIEARYKATEFKAATSVTKSSIDEFILENSALIDARLNSKYIVPITGTEAVKVVKKICIWMTVAETDEIIRGGSLKTGESNRAMRFQSLANKELSMLEKGMSELSDALVVTADQISSHNVDNDIKAFFKKDTEQW